jgi:cobalt/nickel transport system ATP-binding protein
MTTEPAVLATVGITHTYPNGVHGLHDATLSIPRGKRTVLLGGNGSGKSTLLLTLAGVLRPTSGELLLDGQRVSHDRRSLERLRGSVGLVFQDPDVQLFAADVRQDVSFGPLNLGWSRARVAEAVERALADTGLGALADRPVHMLSHGQKKRAAIAGVLAMEPRVVLADEPTAGLDAAMTTRLMEIFSRLNADGRTILVATHDADLALAWADLAIVLDAGTVVAAGPPVDVLDDVELMTRSGLARPSVLAIMDSLVEAGRLPSSLPRPRTPSELASMLVEHTSPNRVAPNRVAPNRVASPSA